MGDKSILMLSDGPVLTTGYATITRKLLNYLTKNHNWETHFLQHTANNQTLKPGVKLMDDEEFLFYTHGAGVRPYCEDMIMPKIRELRPKVFGVLLDTFMAYQSGFLNQDFSPAKSFFYFPSDGGGGLKDGKLIKGLGCNLPLGCESILRKVDVPVAMSMFAKIQAKEVHNIDCEYIPHAVEPEVYKPLSEQERQQIKMKYGLAGKFVVG